MNSKVILHIQILGVSEIIILIFDKNTVSNFLNYYHNLSF